METTETIKSKIKILESEARAIFQDHLDRRISFYDQINIFLQQIKHTFIDNKPGVTKEFDLLYEILSKTIENWDKFRASVQIDKNIEFISLSEQQTQDQIKLRVQQHSSHLKENEEYDNKNFNNEKTLNTSISFYDPYLIGSVFTIESSRSL